MSCAKCGIRSSKLQRCGGCMSVSYCSAACQKQDWKTHKSACQAQQMQTPSSQRIASVTGKSGETAEEARQRRLMMEHFLTAANVKIFDDPQAQGHGHSHGGKPCHGHGGGGHGGHGGHGAHGAHGGHGGHGAHGGHGGHGNQSAHNHGNHNHGHGNSQAMQSLVGNKGAQDHGHSHGDGGHNHSHGDHDHHNHGDHDNHNHSHNHNHDHGGGDEGLEGHNHSHADHNHNHNHDHHNHHNHNHGDASENQIEGAVKGEHAHSHGDNHDHAHNHAHHNHNHGGHGPHNHAHEPNEESSLDSTQNHSHSHGSNEDGSNHSHGHAHQHHKDCSHYSPEQDSSSNETNTSNNLLTSNSQSESTNSQSNAKVSLDSSSSKPSGAGPVEKVKPKIPVYVPPAVRLIDSIESLSQEVNSSLSEWAQVSNTENLFNMEYTSKGSEKKFSFVPIKQISENQIDRKRRMKTCPMCQNAKSINEQEKLNKNNENQNSEKDKNIKEDLNQHAVVSQQLEEAFYSRKCMPPPLVASSADAHPSREYNSYTDTILEIHLFNDKKTFKKSNSEPKNNLEELYVIQVLVRQAIATADLNKSNSNNNNNNSNNNTLGGGGSHEVVSRLQFYTKKSSVNDDWIYFYQLVIDFIISLSKENKILKSNANVCTPLPALLSKNNSNNVSLPSVCIPSLLCVWSDRCELCGSVGMEGEEEISEKVQNLPADENAKALFFSTALDKATVSAVESKEKAVGVMSSLYNSHRLADLKFNVFPYSHTIPMLQSWSGLEDEMKLKLKRKDNKNHVIKKNGVTVNVVFEEESPVELMQGVPLDTDRKNAQDKLSFYIL